MLIEFNNDHCVAAQSVVWNIVEADDFEGQCGSLGDRRRRQRTVGHTRGGATSGGSSRISVFANVSLGHRAVSLDEEQLGRIVQHFTGDDASVDVDATGVVVFPSRLVSTGGVVVLTSVEHASGSSVGGCIVLDDVAVIDYNEVALDRKSTRLNSSHTDISRMPSSA